MSYFPKVAKDKVKLPNIRHVKCRQAAVEQLIETDISSQDMSIRQNRDIITLALTLLALLKLTMKMWQPAMTIASSNMAAILC